MPKLDGILETAIYTEDITRSRAFYEGLLGLEPIYSDNRLSAYAVGGRDVLLVFRKGTTEQTVTLPNGTIPGHAGDGTLHVAFAIQKDERVLWLRAPVLASGVFLGSAAWWLFLSAGVSLLRSRLGPRHLTWINRTAGVLLLGFAAASLLELVGHARA